MAAVVYVQEIVEETEVHVVPSTSKARHCSMKASTSDQDSSTSSGRKLGKKRSSVCAKALMALKDRKKLKKAVTRRVKKVQLKAVSFLRARRVRARIDKELDPEIEEYQREFRSLRAQRQRLLEESAQCIDHVEQMTRRAREIRQEVESRQTVSLAVLLSHLLPQERY